MPKNTVYKTLNDQELTAELFDVESWMLDREESYGGEIAAKMYLCLAHDWYMLGTVSEGTRLVERAKLLCPDYFTSGIYEDMKYDPEFSTLVKGLMNTAGASLLRSFGTSL